MIILVGWGGGGIINVICMCVYMDKHQSQILCASIFSLPVATHTVAKLHCMSCIHYLQLF